MNGNFAFLDSKLVNFTRSGQLFTSRVKAIVNEWVRRRVCNPYHGFRGLNPIRNPRNEAHGLDGSGRSPISHLEHYNFSWSKAFLSTLRIGDKRNGNGWSNSNSMFWSKISKAPVFGSLTSQELFQSRIFANFPNPRVLPLRNP